MFSFLFVRFVLATKQYSSTYLSLLYFHTRSECTSMLWNVHERILLNTRLWRDELASVKYLSNFATRWNECSEKLTPHKTRPYYLWNKSENRIIREDFIFIGTRFILTALAYLLKTNTYIFRENFVLIFLECWVKLLLLTNVLRADNFSTKLFILSITNQQRKKGHWDLFGHLQIQK